MALPSPLLSLMSFDLLYVVSKDQSLASFLLEVDSECSRLLSYFVELWLIQKENLKDTIVEVLSVLKTV